MFAGAKNFPCIHPKTPMSPTPMSPFLNTGNLWSSLAAVTHIKFRDESIGKLSVSLAGLRFPYQFNIDLLGTEGAIRDNRIYSKSLFPEQRDFITLSLDSPNSGTVDHHPFQREIDNLADHILHDTPILVRSSGCLQFHGNRFSNRRVGRYGKTEWNKC